MSLTDDADLTIILCKFGGPLALFVCAPIYAFIMFSIYKTDLASGGNMSIGLADLANAAIFFIILWFGFWMFKKGFRSSEE